MENPVLKSIHPLIERLREKYSVSINYDIPFIIVDKMELKEGTKVASDIPSVFSVEGIEAQKYISDCPIQMDTEDYILYILEENGCISVKDTE